MMLICGQVIRQINLIRDSMIRIIHQIWDKEEIPEQLLEWSNTWKSFHPNWNYKLWTMNKIDSFMKNEFPDYYDFFSNYPTTIQKIDAFRYFMLYKFGGLYVDFDVLCKKNIEHLLEDDCTVFQTYPDTQTFNMIQTDNREHPLRKHFPLHLLAKGYFLTNSLIYSKPEHRFLKRCISHLSESFEESKRYKFTEFDFLNKSSECHTDIIMSTGPGFLTRMFFKYGNIYKVKDHSYKFFECFDHMKRKDLVKEKNIELPEGSCGVHLNLGNWISIKDSQYKYE